MYKSQIICILIVLFITLLHFTSNNKKTASSRCFSALLVCTFFQLSFDIVTIYTVNHLELVSPITNRIAHDIYLGLMLSIFYLVYRYLETIIEEEIGRKLRRALLAPIPLVITLLGVIFLPLDYIESTRSNYSYGPAAFMAYIGVATYLIFIVLLLMQYRKIIPLKKKRAIYFALLSEIPVAVYQIMVPDSLISCLAMVLLNVGIYMTTENPDAHLVEQLEKEKQRANAANQAKTKFLANMSHEIRTPITAVLGMNELLLRETKEPGTKQYAKNIEGAAKSLLSIINDILDISKIEAGKLTVISTEYNLADVIKDISNMISFKASMKELNFQLLIDENIPRKLIGDDIRLRQILVNLLNNAVKYTHKGSVLLHVHLMPSTDEDFAVVHFSVEDTGIGIREEDIKKLNAPYVRVDEQQNRNIEGTGLGISITKELLRLLHSRLQILSKYGVGSVFSFTLRQKIVDKRPIGVMTLNQEENYMEYQHSFEAPNARILLVDDNEMNRHVFVGLLKETKIRIDEAANGREGLEKIKSNAYDIIFMDHMMPDLDGVETFRLMKELDNFPSKDAPVVILTANALVGAKEKYLAEGFRAFLDKPIDHQKLEALIAELLDDSLLEEAGAPTGTSLYAPVERPFVEGLDWNYVRIHFTSENALTESVTLFADSIEYEADALEYLLQAMPTAEQEGNLLCTKFHSMKSSATTIGILPLAGMAKVLEDAARNSDHDTITRMAPLYLALWRSYKEKLAMFSTATEDVQKPDASDHEVQITDLLSQIRKAATAMDIDELDLLWKQLDAFRYDGPVQARMEAIHRAILDFDVDFLQNID